MTATFSYQLLDLGGLDFPSLEARLNRLGAEGWQLVAVVPPQTAILSLTIEALAQVAERRPTQSVTAKYRDPETGETWSGRGRMATWLAERIKNGSRLDDFLT